MAINYYGNKLLFFHAGLTLISLISLVSRMTAKVTYDTSHFTQVLLYIPWRKNQPTELRHTQYTTQQDGTRHDAT